MFWRRRLACSFCGRAAADVAKLVAGYPRRVYICDRCVELAREIIEEDDGKPRDPAVSRRGAGRLWAWLRQRRGRGPAGFSEFRSGIA